MSISEIVTAGIAICGMILSVYTLLRQSRKEKPRVQAWLSHGNIRSPENNFIALELKAANVGDVAVTLSSAWLALPDKQGGLTSLRYRSSAPFPCRLAPGEGCSVWMDVYEIADNLKERLYHGKIELRSAFKDGTNKKYFSPPYEFDVDGWLKVKGH